MLLPISLPTLLPWIPPPSNSLALCFITSHQACSRCGSLESIWIFATFCFLQVIPDTFCDTHPICLWATFLFWPLYWRCDLMAPRLSCAGHFLLSLSASLSPLHRAFARTYLAIVRHMQSECAGASTLWGQPLTRACRQVCLSSSL